MQVSITVPVELRDLNKARKITLRQFIGSAQSESGVEFDILLTSHGLIICRKDNMHEAEVAFAPLIETAGALLLEHVDALEKEGPGGG